MTNTAENIAELAYSRLKTSSNAGMVLSQLYSSLFGVDVGRSELIKFNLLVKKFGRTSVFFAVLAVSRKEEPFKEFPYGLLHKICMDRLEMDLQVGISTSSYESLDRLINETEKEMLRVKKIDPEKASRFLQEDEE